MTTLNCLRPNCQHQWTNNGEPPQCCPKCRNYRYDELQQPRRNSLDKMEGIHEPGKGWPRWRQA